MLTHKFILYVVFNSFMELEAYIWVHFPYGQKKVKFILAWFCCLSICYLKMHLLYKAICTGCRVLVDNYFLLQNLLLHSIILWPIAYTEKSVVSITICTLKIMPYFFLYLLDCTFYYQFIYLSLYLLILRNFPMI